jgi:predicted aspartyl protease
MMQGMMQGLVDQNCEATIRLVVGNPDSQRQVIDAVIDTGFTGFLTLPFSVLLSLGLQACRREQETLGDGSTCIFDVYRGVVNACQTRSRGTSMRRSKTRSSLESGWLE